MDGGPADFVAGYLGKGEVGFLPGLTHGALTDRDSLAPATVFTVEHGGEHTATLDSPLLK